jgi:hypothetical protein
LGDAQQLGLDGRAQPRRRLGEVEMDGDTRGLAHVSGVVGED